jgi:hypothetical protein
MSTISLRLPESLHRQLRELAQAEGISINQLIATAAAEKVAVLTTLDYLGERAGRGDRERFERILDRVPDVEPEPSDRLIEP